MTKTFEQKVIREGIVDTKNYRYRVHDTGKESRIERIEISKLDTTEALNGWKIVKVLWEA